jgi:hypothetical protein
MDCIENIVDGQGRLSCLPNLHLERSKKIIRERVREEKNEIE